MSCAMFDRRLQQVLDERQRPDEDADLRAHALGCDRCFRLLVSQDQVLTGLKASWPAGPRHSVAPYVVARVDVVRDQRRSQQFLSTLAFAVPMAAVVLIAIVPHFWRATNGSAVSRVDPTSSGDRGNTLPSHSPVGRDPAAAWPLKALAVPYAARLSRGDSSDGLQHAVRHWYQELDPERGLERVSDLTGGLKPIASTVHAAIGTIWSTIPKAQVPDSSGSTTAA